MSRERGDDGDHVTPSPSFVLIILLAIMTYNLVNIRLTRVVATNHPHRKWPLMGEPMIA
jgi:hypothetical protein